MTNSLLMNLQRGDVVLCQVPMPSTGFQQFKIRPAVVVSASQLNQILDDVMVVHYRALVLTFEKFASAVRSVNLKRKYFAFVNLLPPLLFSTTG